MPIDFKPLEDKIDFKAGNTATIDFQPAETKLKRFALTPISKQLTGKTITEHLGTAERREKKGKIGVRPGH